MGQIHAAVAKICLLSYVFLGLYVGVWRPGSGPGHRVRPADEACADVRPFKWVPPNWSQKIILPVLLIRYMSQWCVVIILEALYTSGCNLFLCFFSLPNSPPGVQTSSNMCSVRTTRILTSKWSGSTTGSGCFVLPEWEYGLFLYYGGDFICCVSLGFIEIFWIWKQYRKSLKKSENQKFLLSHSPLLNPCFLALWIPASPLPRSQCLSRLSRPPPNVPCPLLFHLSPNLPILEASMSTLHPSSQCKRYAFYLVPFLYLM